MVLTSLEQKRSSESSEVQLAGQRLSKRRTGSKALFVNDYEDICLGMSELKHESICENPLSDFHVLLDAFIELNVEEREEYTRPIEALLDLEWHSTLTLVDRTYIPIRRALSLCASCGIETFRDVLWYNKTLSQAAGLRRFPICLVDTAYHLTEWQPRKVKPMASIETWRNAWVALAQIWPNLCLSLPRELKQILLVRKYNLPPDTANWFEFNYFDGIYSRMEPLLCYHDERVDSTIETTDGDSEAGLHARDSEDVSLLETGALSDEDPRHAITNGPGAQS
ncbi:protein of unknown function [Taphrina deformans PYCC 5710]|uniref:Uncharacterized protein n=1 Tax=Taphrina deformans (strain PYCC 5710 / ATCC 11124 / CBS 356.35 / IMI 108563 / JCM 9778 / NBRC 8474) TaxID=1097556 RepID=R4XIG9_TAPDE|nr:protein of unknown function [Taphrina deformans PYCC 5710]|eukprot:CCG83152.1 protein of unknown function [Taphrina deformans PYCC 5710]